MASKSVGTLHTIVSANAAPYVNELRRASSATRDHAASVSGQFDELQKKIGRKFSGAEIGMDLLRGFGIGSAAGIAQKLYEGIADNLREASEYAAQLDQRAASVAESMRAASKSNVALFKESLTDPKERLAFVEKETAMLEKRRAALLKTRQDAVDAFAWANKYFGGSTAPVIYSFKGEAFDTKKTGKPGVFTMGATAKEFTDIMGARADAAQKEAADLVKDLNAAKSEVAKLKADIEKAKADEAVREMGLLAAQVNLGRGLSAAQVRGGGAAEDYFRGQVEAAKMLDEIEAAKAKRLADIEKLATGPRVDDLTRRGLGTGGGYLEAQKRQESVLVEIREILKRRASRELLPVFGD